jgi:hypothetical protein
VVSVPAGVRGRRAILSLQFLLCALPAAGDGPAWYARGEAGQAVTVPWLGARLGRVLQDGPLALDLGAGGSFGGRGFVTLTGGLEVRAFASDRVSPFARVEGGVMSRSMEGSNGVFSLGGGLAVRLSRAWSVRAGLMRSLQVSDSLSGPDYAYLGLETRW